MSEMDRIKSELQREKERIIMILETERQLDAIMGGIMRRIKDDDEACQALHSLSIDEARDLAVPIVKNMGKMVEMLRRKNSSDFE